MVFFGDLRCYPSYRRRNWRDKTAKREMCVTVFESAFADEELADNKSRAVTINGQSILICRAAGELYALENRCSHQEAELEGGRIRRLLYFLSVTWREI